MQFNQFFNTYTRSISRFGSVALAALWGGTVAYILLQPAPKTVEKPTETATHPLCVRVNQGDSMIANLIEVSKNRPLSEPIIQKMKDRGYELTVSKGSSPMGELKHVQSNKSLSFLFSFDGNIEVFSMPETEISQYIAEFDCLGYSTKIKQLTYSKNITASFKDPLFIQHAKFLDDLDRLSLSSKNDAWLDQLSQWGYGVENLDEHNPLNTSAMIGDKDSLSRTILNVYNDVIFVNFSVSDKIAAQNLQNLLRIKGYESAVSLMVYDLRVIAHKKIKKD